MSSDWKDNKGWIFLLFQGRRIHCSCIPICTDFLAQNRAIFLLYISRFVLLYFPLYFSLWPHQRLPRPCTTRAFSIFKKTDVFAICEEFLSKLGLLTQRLYTRDVSLYISAVAYFAHQRGQKYRDSKIKPHQNSSPLTLPASNN